MSHSDRFRVSALTNLDMPMFSTANYGSVQATLDALEAAGGGLLLVPPSDTVISATLVIPDVPTTIVGMGDGSIWRTSANIPMVSKIGGREFHVRGMHFVGNSTGNQQRGVDLEGVDGFSVNDNTFTDLTRGVRCVWNDTLSRSTQNGQVIGNRFNNTLVVPIFLKTNVLNVVVSLNVMNGIGNGVDPCYGIVVDDGSSSDSYPAVASKNIVVQGNVIADLDGDDESRGIVVSGSESINVLGNILSRIGTVSAAGGAHGISIGIGGDGGSGLNNSCVGNILNGIGGNGFNFSSQNGLTCIGNSVVDYGANVGPATLVAGIRVGGSTDNCLVSTNRIVAGAGASRGIYITVSSIDNAKVFGNAIDANGVVGFVELANFGTGTITAPNADNQFSATSAGLSLGTITTGTVTPNLALNRFKYYTNDGAHTLAPPTIDGSCWVLITNGASAGAITTSGFSAVVGNSFTTTNTDAFLCEISRINGISTLNVKTVSGVATTAAPRFTGTMVSGHTAALTYNGASTQSYQISSTSATTASIALGEWANDAASANLVFAKSRSGTVGTHTVAQADDDLGIVRFLGSDGTGFISAAQILAEVDGTPGTNDMPGRLVFKTTPDGSATSGERLRISADGSIQHSSGVRTIVSLASHLTLRSYTVGTLPVATTAAQMIYVSDGTSNKRLAVSDGTDWRWPDGAIVS